jgi:ribosomal protein L37AE/L43A
MRESYFFFRQSCDVRSNQGQFCPEPVAFEVEHEGKMVSLCVRCHEMWKLGAYNNETLQPKTKSQGSLGMPPI